jgi:transposase
MKTLGLIATTHRKPVTVDTPEAPVAVGNLLRCSGCGQLTDPIHIIQSLCDLCTAEREDYLEDDYRNRYPEYYE